ncbi:hypothetical protein EB061_00840, partial [bacterium]|nr:hypothetical protein [bacterium]
VAASFKRSFSAPASEKRLKHKKIPTDLPIHSIRTHFNQKAVKSQPGRGIPLSLCSGISLE